MGKFAAYLNLALGPCAASGPHEHNNGIAIVFRGEPFRGLTYAVQGIPKQAFACTRRAVAIQRAIGRAHVARLIAPLEKEFKVDVYLAATASPTCRAVQHLPQLYGRRRVVNMTTAAWVGQNHASPTNMHDTKTYNVYRDDYTPHGHAVCASLAQFGGPPCPTRAEGVRIACNRVREEFRKNPPRRNKRCVPMTGKQRCELVPGGCTN